MPHSGSVMLLINQAYSNQALLIKNRMKQLFLGQNDLFPNAVILISSEIAELSHLRLENLGNWTWLKSMTVVVERLPKLLSCQLSTKTTWPSFLRRYASSDATKHIVRSPEATPEVLVLNDKQLANILPDLKE